MGYFQVRYNSRVINYDCIGFIRLATEINFMQPTRSETKALEGIFPFFILRSF